MKPRLNLANTPLENHRRFIVGNGLLGGLALIALVLLALTAYRSWRANRELRTQISVYQAQIRDSQRQQQTLRAFFEQPQQRQVMDRAAFLNSLIAQRSFPWTKIFMDLEESLPLGVRVVSIAPKMQNGRVEVRLVIGAIGDEEKVKFLKAMEASKVFSNVQVRQETAVTQAVSQDRILVELVAWYATT